MRVSSAPVLVLAALTVAGCSGPGAALPAKPSPTPPAAPRAVGCDQIIQQVGPPGGRVVLGVLAVPPARLGRAAPAGIRPWAYFAKHGIDIRAGTPAVLVTVPAAWRRRAAIAWGNNVGAVSSLRLLTCPRQLGAWNGYAGGFYLRSASGCVPLVLQIGRRTAALRVAIGSSTCGSAR